MEHIFLRIPLLTRCFANADSQKMVNDFAAKIDIENTNQILQYGAGTQKKMADFSDTALENVKTQDLGEIGELISNVVGELKDFDVQEEGKFFGFFRKQTSKIENLKNKYERAFSQSDSVIIFKMSSSCEIIRYGYAKNDEKDFIII